jgi:hypothetical protein
MRAVVKVLLCQGIGPLHSAPSELLMAAPDALFGSRAYGINASGRAPIRVAPVKRTNGLHEGQRFVR